MRIPEHARTPVALAALAATLLGACAAMGPRAERWVVPAPGSTWEMAQRNTGSYGKDVRYSVTSGTTTWKGAPAVALKNSMGSTILADPQTGKWLVVLGPNGQPAMSYDPPMGWEYPLHVGKSWSGHQRLTLHGPGRTLEFDFTCKVDGVEKVSVAAGSFDTFRIFCEGPGSKETYWSSTENGQFVKTRLVREPNNPFGPGTQESELVSRGTR